MATVTDYSALISGYNWWGAATTGRPLFLTYSFDTTAPSYMSSEFPAAFVASFQPFSAADQSLARNALDQWAAASGIVFIEVAAGQGDMRFGRYNFATIGEDDAAAFAALPEVSISATWAFESRVSGDVFLNATEPNTLYYMLHEIGHALGLKHPFEDDPLLDPTLDTTANTVMSYNGAPPGALRQLDRDAIAALYGATDGANLSSWSWNAATATLTQSGTAGADWIRGVAVADVIYGQDGDDILFGGFGFNTIYGGAGNDALLGGDDRDVLYGEDGDDFLYGGLGDNSLYGGAGRDRIRSVGGQDIIFAGEGDDEIEVVRSSGAIAIHGGGGFDALTLDRGTLTVGQRITMPAAGVGADFTLTTGLVVTGIELLRLTTGSGDDHVSFLNLPTLGEQYFDGGLGNDSAIADLSSMGEGIIVNFQEFNSEYSIVSRAGQSILRLLNVETLTIYGGSGDDMFNDGSGSEEFWGGEGNDYFYSSGGADKLYGGAGDDFFYISGTSARLIDCGSGVDRVVIFRPDLTANQLIHLTADENGSTVSLTDGTTVTGVETMGIQLGSGDDTVIFENLVVPGEQWFDGGTGFDRVSMDFSHVTSNVYAGASAVSTLGASPDGAGWVFHSIQLSSVERITVFGGSGNDRLSGLGAANPNGVVVPNVLVGNAGDDFLNSFAPGDILDGGPGMDHISISRPNETRDLSFVFDSRPEGHSFVLPDGTRVTGGEVFSIETGSGNDHVTFGNLGYASFQSFRGGPGFDSVVVDFSAFTSAVYSSSEYNIWVWPMDRSVTLFDVEDVTVLGGTGNDRLYLGLRNDTFRGGLGDDILWGGAGIDTALFSGAYAAYTIIRTGASIEVSGPDGVDTLTGIERAIFDDRTVVFGQGPLSGDFNLDLNADILWQNTNGQAAIWTMNGFAQTGGSPVGGNPGPDWRIKAAADFDGDGCADILWQNTNGQAAIWLMDGLTQLGGGHVGGNPGPAWRIRGAGDFNGDGRADILWQNDDGQAAIWLMDGLTQLDASPVGGNPGSAWRVVGAGDFDADGKSDILWQNQNGQAAVWLMDGLTLRFGGPTGGNPGSAWRVRGTGDFDGDARSDILWQNDNGQAAIWTMYGLSQLGGSPVGGNPGSSWRVMGAGDVNGDGRADILWQNANGQAAVWTMDGFTQLGGSLIGGNPGTSWQMLAAAS